MKSQVADGLVAISLLKPHPRNPNRHDDSQIERLADVLNFQGWRSPIIVSKRSGFVVAGHGRLLAARKNGWDMAPVSYQDFESDEAEYAFLVSDNAIASWAELDLSRINFDIQNLGPDFDLDMLGIKDFVLEPADKYGDQDADAVPEPGIALVRSGDLFTLGSHRLLCGDSTDSLQVARLMNGEKADMVFTDPPYGVNAVHNMRVGGDSPTGWDKTTGEGSGKIWKARVYRPIEGDNKPFDPTHVLSMADKVLLWGANYYSDRLPLGMRWVVWDKKAGIGSDECSFSDCELAWTNLDGRAVKIYRHLWSGLLRSGNRNEELTARVHPTQKPVGLCADIINDLAEKTDSILDVYLGSGSTLIACEKTNRKCYGMEIDPIYCGVILDRWAKFTGKDPVREDGKAWSEIKSDTLS